MKLHLPGRADEPAERLPSTFELPDFTWTDPPPDEPLEPPPPPGPPPHRRRRLVALLALILVVGGAGVVTALLVGGGGEKPLSQRDKAQLEAAAPGSSKQGRKASLAVPSVVNRTARTLPVPRAVAQLFVVGTTAQYPGDAFFGRLRGRDWGAVVIGPDNVVDEGQAEALTGEISAVARRADHLVPLVAAQQAGGPASAFPDLPPRAQPLAGDSGGPARARADARAAARALRRLGVRMTFAPVADVGVAAGPVQDQVFADDARVVTRLTAAAVDGYRRGRVIAAVGHFPGQGSASEDPDVANATVGFSLSELRRRDLRPFAAVARRAPVIQMSNAVYATWDGVTPATVLPDAIGQLLRGDLHYRGVVMTPDLTSTAPVLGVGVGTAAVKALEAGADVLYVSGGPAAQDAAYRAVLRAVRKGRISRERLRLSLQRVLALKRRYGLPVAVGRRPRAVRRRAGRRPHRDESTTRGRTMAKGPQPGDPAPDFELQGTEGPFRLSDHRGERVVLLFYPGDETPVCTKQFCSYRDRADDMAQLDATVVGISAQSLDSHERFRDHHGLNVPLLADADTKVAKSYGVTVPALGTRRATFVIDEDGVVRYRHVHTLGLDFQDVDELREALASVPARA